MQITSRDICTRFDPLPKFNILGFQSLFTRAVCIRLHNYLRENYKKISILKNVIKISYNNPQIESSKDRAKHDCFKNKWNLENPTVKIINFEKAPLQGNVKQDQITWLSSFHYLDNLPWCIQ